VNATTTQCRYLRYQVIRDAKTPASKLIEVPVSIVYPGVEQIARKTVKKGAKTMLRILKYRGMLKEERINGWTND